MYTKKNLLFNLIQNIFVGLSITIAVTLLSGGFTTAWDFLISFLKAYVINYIACLIFPIPFLSSKLFRLFKISPKSILRLIINVLLSDIFYVTFVTIIMFIWQLGFTSLMLEMWLSMYWVLLIVAFVVGLLATNLSMSITNKIIRNGDQKTATPNQNANENDEKDNCE